MESPTKIVPIQLADGTIIRLEATVFGKSVEETPVAIGEEIETDVSFKIPLKEVTDAIEGIAGAIKKSLDKVKPSKASVEFALEFGYESGELTAMIVKGTGKANLKITLEWSN
ncbi:hypothetical protein NG796_07980 [Laspinema sp. A4]|uniref:CU044_2847 family protein n=1 Tax=Laspinema sp. D2d TaxID=2953686 RepID=UPI0021BAC0FE|nr:CU044_2847 family protein [Laspinema sp. D2d]MCT7983228.1 hypothetical protein [Laspinema sp. D2d]